NCSLIPVSFPIHNPGCGCCCSIAAQPACACCCLAWTSCCCAAVGSPNTTVATDCGGRGGGAVPLPVNGRRSPNSFASCDGVVVSSSTRADCSICRSISLFMVGWSNRSSNIEIDTS